MSSGSLISERLASAIREKQSLLCVGLDPDINRLPKGFDRSPEDVLRFNRAIIEATLPFAVAYKPNFAFYEALGERGFRVLHQTISHIGRRAVVIADAKRGDIGNTARQYAKSIYEELGCDAATVSPYMGADTIEPFLAYPKTLTFVLALTSNEGSSDLQLLPAPEQPLYLKTVEMAGRARGRGELGFVVGATQATEVAQLREAAPDNFVLVPGIGAQGGDLNAVLDQAMLPEVFGMVVNSSRGILYASADTDFAEAAENAARGLQQATARVIQ